MVSTTVVGLVVYLVFYKFISKYQSYDLKDPNTSLFRVVGQRTEALIKQLTEALMNLEQATSIQEKLWSFIMADMDALSDHRFIRLDAALAKPPVYIYVIIFGFLVTMACFGVYRPQGPLVVLVSLYTVFVGLVLFLIMKLSDPFQGDISVPPTAFEYLVETLLSEIR